MREEYPLSRQRINEYVKSFGVRIGDEYRSTICICSTMRDIHAMLQEN